MSFLKYKRFVEEGDTAILCRGREKIFPVTVKKGELIQIRGGCIQHESLVGVEYGSKVNTQNGKGWVLLLHPTPELWTVALPHRTQIIYSTDISVITMMLELRPGAVVCECGTGSGSLSHALARTVAPTGHLYTFEFHKKRAELARQEFQDHGLTEVITIECRDVCQMGFGLSNVADAVFLDLPSPWDAVKSAKESMKVSGGRLCSFSPCIEQVQRTCDVLRQEGFVDVEVMECLQRPFDVRPCIINIPYLGEVAPVQDHLTSPEAHTSGETMEVVESDDKEKSRKRKKDPLSSSITIHTAAQHRSIPGHTGYLTFATLYHKSLLQI